MTAKSRSKATRETSAARSEAPIRWDDLPHHDLFADASQKLGLGSISRAHEDAERSILRRRLPALVPADHFRYSQLTAARILEYLRSIRDTYLLHLKGMGCKPLSELAWVVLRFGVMDWAVMLLRSAVIDYISEAQINATAWESLFDPWTFLLRESPLQQDQDRLLSMDAHQTFVQGVARLLPKDCFTEVLTGGPFGRLGQVDLARQVAGPSMMSGETLPEIITDREHLWDASTPWAEVLARLFDAVQEELFLQRDLLGETGREKEITFGSLTPFEQIVYRRLRELRAGTDNAARLGEKGWLALVDELDDGGVSLKHLSGNARRVLSSVRKKGQTVSTWKECYLSKARTSFEDGKLYGLKREVMLAIHDTAKRAASRIAAVSSR